ncbi:MAG: ABC transporter permease, partial [Planctomycetota bacterium]|jgi:ABC-2 type transport system permease protein
VTISQLISGKFLAALCYLTLLLVLTLGLPITLSIFAENGLDWGPVAMTYVACLLMAAAYLSIGMFWSTITRDQIIAFLLALVTLVGLFYLGHPTFINWLTATMPDWPGQAWAVLFIRGISPFGYFESISRGMLDTGDLVYYVCFTAFFLHANALVIYGKRVKG